MARPGNAARSRGIRLLSHSDQGGRPDGVQIMVHRGFAYIGHIFSNGVTVMDVRDPRHPKAVSFLPAFRNCWNIHLQTHDDLLLVNDEVNFFAHPTFAREENYFSKPVADSLGRTAVDPFGQRGVDYIAGVSVYDISTPERPMRIGRLAIDGFGVHRIWYVGGRFAYVSALMDGYTDHILMIVDVSDPRQPREVSRWWLPGMWTAGGERPAWRAGERVGLHHAIVADGVAYGSWRDGGVTLIDVSDPAKPTLLAHRNWNPPFGGGTHSALPLTDRVPKPKDYLIVADEPLADDCADSIKYTWVVDIREKTNPVTVATFPTPADRDYCREGGHFGPHNLHENRPGSFQSSELIFVTYQNAGVRVFDIRSAHRPEEVAWYVPSVSFDTWVDTRPGRPRAIHSADVYVDPDGVMYVTDFNFGLHILEFRGG